MSKMNQVYGLGQALISSLPPPQLFQTNPNSSQQTNWEVGQIGYTGTSGAYTFYIYAGDGVWELLDIATGALDTLTGDTGTATPTAGDIKIAGTTNQVATTASGSTVTLSLIGPYTPATYTAHGVLIGEAASSITATSAGTAGQLLTSGGASADPTWTTSTFPNTAVRGDILYASATNTIGSLADVATGQVLASGGVGAIPAYTGSPSISGSLTANGNVVLNTATSKLNYTSLATTTTAGANSAGTVTLVGGTATVSTTSITAASKVRLTRQSVGSTSTNPLGLLSVGTISANTSFVINAWSSTDATALATTDVSSIFWEIVN